VKGEKKTANPQKGCGQDMRDKLGSGHVVAPRGVGEDALVPTTLGTR